MAERGIGLVLCVDDYGLAPGIGRAVRRLAIAGRISATSCMTTMPSWESEGRLLKEFDGRIDIGLHLTLTDQKPLGPMPGLAGSGRFPTMGALLRRSMMGRLDREEVLGELQRQLESFTSVFGRLPDFIDGHHHVHQFPLVRDAVIALLRQWPTESMPWVRVCSESPKRIFRRGVSVGRALSIGFFGRALRHLAASRGFRTNNGFTGIYNFDTGIFDSDLVEQMICSVTNGSVMMCHAGEVDDVLVSADCLTTPREWELAFLMSDAFPILLETTGIHLGRSSDFF